MDQVGITLTRVSPKWSGFVETQEMLTNKYVGTRGCKLGDEKSTVGI